MDVSRIGFDPVAGRQGASACDALVSLAAKSAAGDLASECALLLSDQMAAELRVNLQGVRLQGRVIQEARQRRIELLKQRWEAQRHASFWSKLGKILGGVAAAVGVAATVFCPAAAAGIAVVGAAAGGIPAVVGAGYGAQASKASAAIMRADSVKQDATSSRADLLQALQNLAEAERRMAARIAAVAESEHRGQLAAAN